MGAIHATVTLVNDFDLLLHEQGRITKDQVRTATTSFAVDDTVFMLCINEHLQEQLGYRKYYRQRALLKNGDIIGVDVVGPVKVCFLNRSTFCLAMVLPGDSIPVLGAIALESMDVAIDKTRCKLTALNTRRLRTVLG